MMLVPGMAAGDPKAKEVVVVNGPTQPVVTEIQGPTEVVGRVDIQQTGPFEVEFEGTPKVEVDDSTPLQVQNQDREPFQVLFKSGHSCGVIPVPENRMVEIETVDLEVRTKSAAELEHMDVSLLFRVVSGEGFTRHHAASIQMFKVRVTDGHQVWQGSATDLSLFAGKIGENYQALDICSGFGIEDQYEGRISGRLE